MADFEELKIQVSLVDNVSSKLKEANTTLTTMGRETAKHFSDNFRLSTESVTRFGQSIRGLADQFGLFGNLPIFRLGAGGGLGFAAIVTAIKATNDALGAFAKELLRVRDLSRSAGLLPDQFKNISSQLKMIGYSTEEAEREITSFFRTVDEAGRAGTSAYMRVYSMSATPDRSIALINQMRDAIRSGSPGRAITMAAQEARAIFERELMRPGGGGRAEATRQAEAWLSSIGLSMRALGITDISDFMGDPQKWQRRIEAAERFNREYETLQKIIGGITAEIKMELLPAFEELNKSISAGAFQGLLDAIKTDAEDFRKILALLEGDWQTLGSLLPVGGLLRNKLMGNPTAPHEVEGPPTPFGQPPINPAGLPQTQSQQEVLKRIQEMNQREGFDLLKELERFNSWLFDQQAKRDARRLNPQFHNQPQGGAVGESDPMQLPAGISQPGGGAAAEARRYPSRQASVPIPQARRPEAQIASYSGPLETLGLIRTGERIYSFGAEGRGREQADIQEAGMGMEGLYGLSFPSQQEPEVFYKPGTGQETTTIGHELGHVGREGVRMWGAAGTGNIFQRYGANLPPPDEAKYGENEAEERLQRMQDFRTAERLLDSGLIGTAEFQARMRRSHGYLEDKGVTGEEYVELSRHASMQERAANTILNQGVEAIRNLPVRPDQPIELPGGGGGSFSPVGSFIPQGYWSPLFNTRTGEQISTGGSIRGAVYGEEPDLPGMRGANDRALVNDSSRFDRALAADAGFDVSADLAVNVRGSKGVEVNASGDGMFKGNTSVSRQVDLQ